MFADGGPVSMSNGGVSDEVTARRASTEEVEQFIRNGQKATMALTLFQLL